MIKHWLWLATCKGITPLMRAKLLHQFGAPEEIYYGDERQYRSLGLSAKQMEGLLDKRLDHLGIILEDCARESIQIITYQDASYPQRLREIADPPCVLYCKGHLADVDETVSIGVVGTRKATPYGLDMAMRTGEELATAGVAVISGMALGIDSAALEGALRGGGTPIAVLGGGLDTVYPIQNTELFQELVSRGAVVSEYPPRISHLSHHFPVRNRIISGLSWGVVAVEAGERSGTGITARLALDQDRDLFAYPGLANVSTSIGTNRLIQEGTAMMTLNPTDILREYGIQPVKATKKPSPQRSTSTPKKVPPESGILELEHKPPAKGFDKGDKKAYITVLEGEKTYTPHQLAILQALQEAPLGSDDLVERTALSVGDILSALTMLQVQGLIAEVSGKRFETMVLITSE